MPITEYEKRLDSERTEAARNDVELVEHFDNMEFWNPKSIDTLVFNNYVGGAYVFEYADGETDVLRINDQYRSQFKGIIPDGTPLGRCGVCNYLAPQERARFFETVQEIKRALSGTPRSITILTHPIFSIRILLLVILNFGNGNLNDWLSCLFL